MNVMKELEIKDVKSINIRPLNPDSLPEWEVNIPGKQKVSPWDFGCRFEIVVVKNDDSIRHIYIAPGLNGTYSGLTCDFLEFT